MFRQNVLSKFSPKVKVNKPIKRIEQSKDKQVEVVELPPSISVRPSKEILEKLKFFNKKSKKAKKPEKSKTLQSYAQASAPNVGKILKLKEIFSNLLAKKIKNIHKTINNSGNIKPKINIITKEPLRKQIIILMSNNNKAKFIVFSRAYINNINSALRNIKMADFVRIDQYSIIIMMNKVISMTDLQTIENYMKNDNHLDSENMEAVTTLS